MPGAEAPSGGDASGGRRWRWGVPGLGPALLRGGAAALVFGLAFPPAGLWPLVVAWPALVAHAALRARSRRAAFVGLWLPHAAAWLMLDAWMQDVTALGWPLLALYCGLWPALTGLLVRPVRRGGPLDGLPVAIALGAAWTGMEAVRGVFLFDGYPWYLLAHPLVEAPALVQSASVLGGFFTGFLVAVVSGAVLDVARLLADRRGGRAAGRAATRARLAATGLAGAILVVVPLHGGFVVDDIELTDIVNRDSNGLRGPRLAIVQTALPQDNKVGWPIRDQVESLQRWLDMAAAAAADAAAGEGGLEPRPVDAIVLPETMLPGFGFDPSVRATLQRIGDVRAMFPAAVERLAAETGATILAGTNHLDALEATPAGDGWRYVFGRRTNAVVSIAPDGGRQRYDKTFLTPFGETMPYISAWPWLERQLLALGARGMTFDLSAGDRTEPLRIANRDDPRSASVNAVPTWRVAAPICFEITVPATVHRLVHADAWSLEPRGIGEGGGIAGGAGGAGGAGDGGDGNTAVTSFEGPADLILNASNDGWFGDSAAGRRRHAQIARLRAIEHRRPVVRAVNTGYSMLIDAAGRIDARLGDGDYGTADLEGVLVVDVPHASRNGRTTYARIGPVWPWIGLGLAGALAVAAMLRGRRTEALDG